jgi:hypothetical protein
MFRNRVRRTLQALALTACAIALVGLSADGAAADGRKGGHRGKHKQYEKHRGHGHSSAPRTVVRYEAPRVVARYVPYGCSADRYVVHHDDPYYYNVNLGAFFGGVHVNVALGNTAPRGYGYWDPYCEQWFESVSVYSAHCDHHHHRPALSVVQVNLP